MSNVGPNVFFSSEKLGPDSIWVSPNPKWVARFSLNFSGFRSGSPVKQKPSFVSEKKQQTLKENQLRERERERKRVFVFVRE